MDGWKTVDGRRRLCSSSCSKHNQAIVKNDAIFSILVSQNRKQDQEKCERFHRLLPQNRFVMKVLPRSDGDSTLSSIQATDLFLKEISHSRLNYKTGIPADKRPARAWGETGMVYA